MFKYRVVIIATLVVGGAFVASAQQPQERSYTVTLGYSEWHAIGEILDEQKAKVVRSIMNKIDSQMIQQDQASVQGAASNLEKAVREKVAAEAKAKAEADKKAAEGPTGEGHNP